MTLQIEVREWTEACFGIDIAKDLKFRSERFVEEAIELAQAVGWDYESVMSCAKHVFSKEPGNPVQEVGGTINTLCGLCDALGIDMEQAGRDELAEMWQKIEAIRAKNLAKQKHLP